MLELVLSPSLTVNSTCVGKLKLTADADVRTLSGTEGRPPGMSCGGAGWSLPTRRNIVRGYQT